MGLVRQDVVEDLGRDNKPICLALNAQGMESQVVSPELAPALGLIEAV